MKIFIREDPFLILNLRNSERSESFYVYDSQYVFINEVGELSSSSQHDNAFFNKYKMFLFKAEPYQGSYKVLHFIKRNLLCNKGGYEQISQNIWLDLNSYSNIGYEINEGNIIRIGDCLYLIRKIFLKAKSSIINIDYSKGNSDHIFNFIFEGIYNSDSIEKTFCIICKKTDSNINNPLMALCQCKNYFHLACFKSNLEIKMVKHGYSIKNFGCKKCGIEYQSQITIKGNKLIYNLVSIEEPKYENFIILESFNSYSEGNYTKNIYIINLDKNKAINLNGKDNNILHFNIVDGKVSIHTINNKSNDILILIQEFSEITEKEVTFKIGNYLVDAKISYEDYDEIFHFNQRNQNTHISDYNEDEFNYENKEKFNEYLEDVDNRDVFYNTSLK